ncbi:unnamed protein product [Ambrosiozyma monospora]|uniref:Unnamed protein product n=1 Tax=Ambrosiozyma monospora TaxID=43982 RepID=A0ACB5T334_AMBMO|nr:unnamed protein product [Ambrosiozyma monospora]
MSLEELTTKLTAHFNLDDYETCSKLLGKIKIELVKSNLLIPTLHTRTNPNDLIITRSILEIGALVSINLLKMKDFSNYITQLKPFYEIGVNEIPESKNKNKLISLYLLLLLTQDDLASFHIELEKFLNVGLSIDELEKDQYLSIPIKFEKWIIDGDFNKRT